MTWGPLEETIARELIPYRLTWTQIDRAESTKLMLCVAPGYSVSPITKAAVIYIER